jgi:CRISPR/Cas system-associated endonuclease/helicase Cas3
MTPKNILIAIVITLLVLGGSVYYISVRKEGVEDQAKFASKENQLERHPQEMTDTKATEREEAEQDAQLYALQDSGKYENEIQDLLNKQCEALSNKDLGLLISTIDQGNINVFEEYRQSVEILLSMTDVVVECQYEIQHVQFSENSEKLILIAETTERGDLQIRLIDGSTKIIEDPSVSNVGKYIKIGEEWKQIIN